MRKKWDIYKWKVTAGEMEKTPIEYPKFGLSFPLDIGFGTPAHGHLKYIITVRYHCGGWPEEVNPCDLNSYMVYL
jgi:hypothetical protein